MPIETPMPFLTDPPVETPMPIETPMPVLTDPPVETPMLIEPALTGVPVIVPAPTPVTNKPFTAAPAQKPMPTGVVQCGSPCVNQPDACYTAVNSCNTCGKQLKQGIGIAAGGYCLSWAYYL